MNIGGYDLYRYILPFMNSNMYMVLSENRAIIIDPICDRVAFELLRKREIRDVIVILTHEHFDHISGVNSVRNVMMEEGGMCEVFGNAYCAEYVKNPDMNLARFFQAMFIMRSDDERKIAEEIFDIEYSCVVDHSFDVDTTLIWEDMTIILHSTPGHSPGSICVEMYGKNQELLALATGDSLVEGNTVITRLPRGSKNDYTNITRPYLEGFAPDTLVFPGHGEIKKMKELVLG